MSESAEDRMLRDRADRKAAADKAIETQEARRNAQRNYTNPARKEEATRTYRELLSPSSASSRPKAAQPAPAGGDTIDFYVYKDGVLGTLKLQTGGAFEPLP